jgi:hypothetical protein
MILGDLTREPERILEFEDRRPKIEDLNPEIQDSKIQDLRMSDC